MYDDGDLPDDGVLPAAAADDGRLRERMKALANERRRFGHRRLHILLRRKGYVVNHKRLFRLYKEERLTCAGAVAASEPNQRWSLDFVSDQLLDGRRFRILTGVDDCTLECLALVADTSLSRMRVARGLDQIIAARDRPATIVSDNGTELTSNAILTWADESRVGWHYIAPGNRPRTPSSRASTAAFATSF